MHALYRINEAAVFVGLLLLIEGVCLLGLRVGLRRREQIARESGASQLSTVLGGLLGLLALLLGFSFAIAQERFDLRKTLLIEEANAIGTLRLRVQTLPIAARAPTERLIRDYVEADVGFYEAGISEAALAEANQRMEQLQSELWTIAAGLAQTDRSAVMGLFLQSLNDTIDLHEKRRAAMEYRIPGAVGFVVIAVAVLASALLGFACGLGPRRDRLAAVVAGFLVVLVVLLIVDLNRPRSGFITTGQQSLLRLQQQIRAAPAGAP